MPSERQYKDAAERIIANLAQSIGVDTAHVESERRPEIQRTSGGAFVQAWLWVPDSEFESVPENDATGVR